MNEWIKRKGMKERQKDSHNSLFKKKIREGEQKRKGFAMWLRK